jgi:hypothetical protein
MLLPNKPVELEKIDPSSFQSPSAEKIAVICARVEYESVGGSYRTQAIYLVQRDLLNKVPVLVNVPGLTTYA